MSQLGAVAPIFPSRLVAALPSRSISSCYHDKHSHTESHTNKVLHTTTEPQDVPLEKLRLNPQNGPSKGVLTPAGVRGNHLECWTPAGSTGCSTTSERSRLLEFRPLGFTKSCLWPVNLFLTTQCSCVQNAEESNTAQQPDLRHLTTM